MVMFVHSMMNAADTVDLQDRSAIEKKEGIAKCMNQVGMPLFFLISGIGMAHIRDEGFDKFLIGKVKRLLIPLAVAIVFLLIPRLYLSQQYEAWTRVDPDKPPEDDFLMFFIGILPLVFGKLSWLWFLVVLFEVSMLCYWPIIMMKRRQMKLEIDFEPVYYAVSMLVWVAICVKAVDEKDAHYLVVASALQFLYPISLLVIAKVNAYWA